MIEPAKILIVDDDKLNLKFLTMILRAEYSVKAVHSGEEALSVIETFIPDLVILDVIMPGIDGYEVCRLIRSQPQYRTIKILILSAKEIIEDKIEGYNAGADDFLVKPFDSPELLAKVKVFIRLKKEEDRRRKAELELRSSELKYRTLFSQANDAILVLNQSIVEDCNNEALKLFKCQCEDIIDKSFLDFSPKFQNNTTTTTKEFEQKLKSIVDDDSKVFQWQCKRHDNSFFQAEIKMSLIEIEGRNLFQLIINDITRQVETELALNRAREIAETANKAKSEFLANISHELRTPLHGILSFSQFGIKKINIVEKPKLLGYFERINSSGHKLLIILNDLLDIARLESGRVNYKFADHDITLITAAVITEMEAVMSQKNITVELNKPKFETIIKCDNLRIEQVIRNILSNAIKYSYQNQKIEISYKQNEINGKKSIIIKIKDQGIGIPVEELNLVFEKFTQGSKTYSGAGGTGLGLAICSEIVSQHQGSLWAESEQPPGSTLCINLPYRQDT